MAPAVVVPSDNQSDVLEPLIVSSSTDINGSVSTATIVQKNCCLHVRGNLVGSLTIEPGANVVIDGFVDGKVINLGGRLVVDHKGLTACVTLDGPSESEAGAILKINLTAIAFNWETLAKRTEAECAAVSSATPTAVASVQSRKRWPNQAAELFLSPIFLKLNASAGSLRIRPFMFSTDSISEPGPPSQSLMRDLLSIAQSSWPRGMLS